MRVVLRLEQGPEPDGELWPPVQEETIEATQAGDNLFRIVAPPIFSDSFNVFDEVFASSVGSRHVAERIVKPSGYFTIRVAPADNSPSGISGISALVSLLEEKANCVIATGGGWPLISIGLPPRSSNTIAMILAAEEEGLWECNRVDFQRFGL